MKDGIFIHVNPNTKVLRSSQAHCFKCRCSKSPAWRIGPNGETWCNKCALRRKREIQKKAIMADQAASPPTSLQSDRLHSSATTRPATSMPSRPGCLFGNISMSPPSQESAPDASSTVHDVASSTNPETLDVSGPAQDSLEPQPPSASSDYPTCESNILSMSSHKGVIGESPSYEMGNSDGQDHEPHHAVLTPELSQIGWDNFVPPASTIVEECNLTTLISPLDDRAGLGFTSVQEEYGSNQLDPIPQDQWVELVDAVTSGSQPTCPSSSEATVLSPQCRQWRGARSLGLPSSQSLSLSTYDSPIGTQSSWNGDIEPQPGHQIAPETSQYFSLMYTPRASRQGDGLKSYLQDVAGCHAGVEGACPCTCSGCLLSVFFDFGKMVGRLPETLLYCLEPPLTTFYRRAAAVHFSALQRDSSLYVATQAFICDYAGEPHIVSAIAILSERFELAPSYSSHYGELAAASRDLAFDFAIVGVAAHPASLDCWLHEQRLVQYLSSERTKFAIWNLGRLPPGHHCPDSPTFRWLQRFLLPINTSSGPQMALDIQSGSEEYQFRRFHKAMALLNDPTNAPVCAELCVTLEPVIRDAGVRSCQEWFVAVLDESARLSSKDSQLRFLTAHKLYMLTSIKIYLQPYEKMKIESCLHVCSLSCISHFQPSFRSLLQSAQDALESLFSPQEELLRNGVSPTYPTREQLIFARVVGLVLYKMYFSNALLPKEKVQEHFLLVRASLARARRELVESTQSELIWNYLPMEIARRAALKLDTAMASLLV